MGIEKDDLSMELDNNGIIITGERKRAGENRHRIREERPHGRFSKSIRLPFPVKADSIKAAIKNGMLTINLEKSDEANPKKIEITAN